MVTVATLVALAIAATFVVDGWRDVGTEVEDGPRRPFEHGARIDPLFGDGHRGTRDGHVFTARFDEPWGLVRGADGSLYVADGGEANRIRRVAPDGEVSTLAGAREGFADGAGAAAAFHTPSALAIGSDGTLYVADTGNHAIRTVSPEGVVATLAGTGVAGFRDGDGTQAQFHAPMGVAVDVQGRVLVADTWNDRIRVIERDGRVHTLAGGDAPGLTDGAGGSARFDTPASLAVAGDGSIWVADTGNDAVRRIDANGMVRTWSSGEPALRRVLALTAAEDGHVYASELSPGRVLQLSPDGGTRVLAGGGALSWFARPSALWLDRDGALLVADAAGHRVHRLVARGDAHDQDQHDPAAALADGPVGPAPERALPDTRRRWPLHPQDAWHEVVGTLGEVRGNFRGESRSHLHNGLDIRGDVGATVLSIDDAKVTSPLAAFSFGGQAEGITVDELTYLHMRIGRTAQGRNLDPSRFQLLVGDEGRNARVRIARGTRFRPGDALGTINAQAHVHLIVGPNGYQHNAIGLGFRDYRDTVPPRIDRVFLLDAQDLPKTRRERDRVVVPRAGGVQVVVDAWDQVDDNLPRRRLGLHRVGYQVLRADGTPVPGFEQPRMNIDFSRMPAHRDAVKVAYAANSGITVHGAARTRFLYVVSNVVRADELAVAHWQPAALPAGDYIIRAHGEDASGNRAVGARDLPVTLVDARPAALDEGGGAVAR